MHVFVSEYSQHTLSSGVCKTAATQLYPLSTFAPSYCFPCPPTHLPAVLKPADEILCRNKFLLFPPPPLSLSPQRCVGSFSLCSLSQVRLICTGHHQLCRRRQFSHICDTEAQAIAKLLCRTELKVLEFSCAGCNLLPMLLQPVEKWGCPVLGH